MTGFQQFEALAATIYSELSPEATVRLDERVRGASGVMRQLDVTIRTEVAGTPVLMVVETKDLGRPADIGEVDEFAGKLADVGANKGILICSGGFTSGATQAAESRGIELSNLHDASSRNWNLEVDLPILWVDVRPTVRFDVVADLEDGDATAPDRDGWIFRSPEGEERNVASEFESMWNGGNLPRFPGRHLIPLEISGEQLRVITSDGEETWRRLEKLTFVVDNDVKTYLGSFTPEQCRGVLSYSSGAFRATHLPFDGIPVERDPAWPEVAAKELAVQPAGTVLTSERWWIEPGATAASVRMAGRAHRGALSWSEEKLTNRMRKWALSRRCVVCGARPAEIAHVAFCGVHDLGQRFPVCRAHASEEGLPPGALGLIDWLVDNGMGVPTARIPNEDLEAYEAALEETGGYHSWPHVSFVRQSGDNPMIPSESPEDD